MLLLVNKTQEKEIAPKTQIVELGNGTGSIKAKNPADAEVVAEEPDKESPTEEEIERARGVKAALKAGKDWAGDFEYVDIDDPIVPQNKSTIPDIVPSTVIPEIVKKPAIVQTVSDTKVESVAPPSDLAPEFVITLPPHNYGNLVTPLPAQSVPVPDVARSFKQLVDISLGNDRQEMPPIPKKPTTITQKLSTLRNKLFPMMSPEADIAFKAQEARKKIISSLDTAHVWWEKQPKHQRLILSVALIGLGLVGTAGGSGLAIGASLAGKAVLRGLGAYGLGTTASSFAKKKLLEKNNGAPLSKETESKLRKAKYAIALGAFLAGSYSDIKDVYNLAHDAFSGATQAVDTVLVKPGPILPITDSLPSTEHSVLPVDTHGAARKVANLAGHTIEHFENVIPNRTLTGIILHGGIFEMATLDDIAKLTVDGKQNFIQNLIENLSPEQLKSVGITSGNPDLLRLTDKINILKLAELAKTITVSVGGEKISLLARALQIK